MLVFEQRLCLRLHNAVNSGRTCITVHFLSWTSCSCIPTVPLGEIIVFVCVIHKKILCYGVCLNDVLLKFKDMLTFACAAMDGAGNCLLTTRPKGSACGPVMPATYSVPMCLCIFSPEDTYEGCLESIHPFWMSWELVMWPWCNLAASQRRPYCASVNSHSPVGLVSRQWDAVDWAYVLCDRRIHKSPPFQRRF